jgi:hypothetical protein
LLRHESGVEFFPCGLTIAESPCVNELTPLAQLSQGAYPGGGGGGKIAKIMSEKQIITEVSEHVGSRGG